MVCFGIWDRFFIGLGGTLLLCCRKFLISVRDLGFSDRGVEEASFGSVDMDFDWVWKELV